MQLSIPTDDLVVGAPLDLAMPLVAVLIGCVVAVAVLIALTVVLSKPRRPRASAPVRGVHRTSTGKAVWHERIDAIVQDHARGSIDRDEAMIRLAAVARDYASAASGRDLSSQTLTDLHRQRSDASQRNGFNLLRQTIGALYPAEFADPSVNDAARGIDVAHAAEWVSALVERWR